MTVQLAGELPPAVGLAQLSLVTGRTVDWLRLRLRRDAELRAKFTLVGNSLVLPASAVPEIVAALRAEPNT